MSAPLAAGRSHQRHRVRLEFDVEILDEEQAKALAAASMGRRVQDSENAGLQPSTSRGQSPEVAVHAVVQDMRAVSVMLALELLRRGAATLPWLEITDVDVRNERPVP